MTWLHCGLTCLLIGLPATLMGGTAQESRKSEVDPDPFSRKNQWASVGHLDRYGDPLPEWALARLGTVRWRTGEYMSAAALSPDGKVIAVSGSRGISFLDTSTGQQLRRLEISVPAARKLGYSPDGKTLVVAAHAQILLLDGVTGAKKAQLSKGLVRHSGMTSLSFSADGRWLTGGFDSFGQRTGPVVWDLRTQTESDPFAVLHNQQIGAVISPSGKVLASWGTSSGARTAEENQTVQLWDVAAVKELRQIKVQTSQVTAAAFSPDGKTIAITGFATLFLFDAETGKERLTLAGRRGMNSVLYSPDGKQLATTTSDGAIQLWDAVAGTRLGACEIPGGRVAFTAEGKALAWVLQSMSLALWEVPSGKRLTPAEEGHPGPIFALAFAPDRNRVLSAGQDGTVCVWDLGTSRQVRRIVLQDEEARRYAPRTFHGLTISPDGRHLAAASAYSNSTRLYDLATGRVVCDFEGGHSGGDARLLFSPDGTVLATGEQQGQFRLLEVHTGREVARLKTSRPRLEQVGGLAFSPDSKVFVLLHSYYVPGTPGQMSELHRVRVSDGKDIGPPIQVTKGLRGLAFSPDGKVIASATGAAIESWDVDTGKALRPLAPATPGHIQNVAFSPDGRTLACSMAIPTGRGEPELGILLFERASGGIRARLSGQLQHIVHLAYSLDGGMLASSGADGTILLWDLTGRRAVAQRTPPKDFDQLWAELVSSDAERSFQAMLLMRAAPARTLQLLEKELKPIAAVKTDPAMIAQWISDLDADRFAVRDKAARALVQVGEPAIPALKKVLDDNLSVEKRRRIEGVLKKLTRDSYSPSELREFRAIEVLEGLGTAEARGLLQRLADGAAAAPLTRQAREALGRWPK
jgi:WD40 repeat protein